MSAPALLLNCPAKEACIHGAEEPTKKKSPATHKSIVFSCSKDVNGHGRTGALLAVDITPKPRLAFQKVFPLHQGNLLGREAGSFKRTSSSRKGATELIIKRCSPSGSNELF